MDTAAAYGTACRKLRDAADLLPAGSSREQGPSLARRERKKARASVAQREWWPAGGLAGHWAYRRRTAAVIGKRTRRVRVPGQATIQRRLFYAARHMVSHGSTGDPALLQAIQSLYAISAAQCIALDRSTT